MNAELPIVQTRFLNLYHQQLVYLRGKPRQFVADLLHESKDLRNHELFSIRASAEINYAACSAIMDGE